MFSSVKEVEGRPVIFCCKKSWQKIYRILQHNTIVKSEEDDIVFIETLFKKLKKINKQADTIGKIFFVRFRGSRNVDICWKK